MGVVVSVNVGTARAIDGIGKNGMSAIDKQPANGAIAAGPLGLAGDEQADRKNHGGPDQAVYAYAVEDLDYWSGALGRELVPGQFGENLTTVAVDVTGAVIGERWRAGTALFEVSRPRIPCTVFQAWLGETQWVRRFTAAARPGAYLRVIEPGAVRAGDAVDVVSRPAHGVTIGVTFRALTTERALLPRLREATQLPAALYEEVCRRASASS
jgi:MOSC domain-containing protein YiiM